MSATQDVQTAVAVSHPAIEEPAIFTLRLPISKTIELFADSQGVDRSECSWTWVTIAEVEKPKLRKRTVFEPCEKHAPMFATESRERRAEVMCEGGYASSPCVGRECRMKPGTDFYTESFVAAHPACGVMGR